MKLKFLGTGTSTGVPQIGCTCSVCKSTDARDKRMRASVLITNNRNNNLLIDCGPDFYHQMLHSDSPRLDALLVTHSHYDHVGGLDDMRPYCSKGPFPVYCQPNVTEDLRIRLPYCFYDYLYPGVPTFDFTELSPFTPIKIAGSEILPVPIMHHKLEILGYKIDNTIAYITDCKIMPEATVEALEEIPVLILNALRITSHLSHLNIEEALEIIEKIKPGVTYLTHFSHQIGMHKNLETILPENVFPAYDGLEIIV